MAFSCHSGLGLTNPVLGAISKIVTSRFHSWIAIALALSVLLILVSPFAASELTTLRGPHKIASFMVAIPVALFAPGLAWSHAPMRAAWDAEQQLVLGGSAIVDLTVARLC